MAGMMCSPYSPKNHWCSSSFGQDVRTLKSVNFIQALEGNSLWRKRCSASLTCQEYFSVCHAYTKHLLWIYLKYTMYITFKFSAYAVHNFWYTWYIHSICHAYMKYKHNICHQKRTLYLHLSRAVPSWFSSRSRSVSNSARISCVSLKGNTWSESCSCSLGHQQLAQYVMGHIVAVDTSSPSIDKKSINTRERRTILSAYRMCISLLVKSLICATRMSMHEWLWLLNLPCAMAAATRLWRSTLTSSTLKSADLREITLFFPNVSFLR